MTEKLKDAWMKFGKFLLWTLLAVLGAFTVYMIAVHWKLIVAAIKGEELPAPDEDKCCPFFCKKD